MRPMIASVLFAATLLLLPAQQPDEAARIRAIRQQSNRAMAAGDFTTFAASLTPDFVITRGNGTFVGDRKAYLEATAAARKAPGAIRYERITDKVQVSTAAPAAAEHGHWIASLPNGKPAYSGTYLAMWRRTGTEWKIRSELFVLLECHDTPACQAYANPR